MKIWLISDTHCKHELLRVPDSVDLVVHCGDEAHAHKPKKNLEEAKPFFEWFQSLPIARKVFVPGNHSIAVEQGLIQPADFPEIVFLIHQLSEFQLGDLSVENNGKLKIFGSPYTPWFFNWAYNVARPDLDAIWATIPTDIDLLITHGPPKGILDVTKDWKSKEPIHIGSMSLTRQVDKRIRPKIHAFGHLHDEPEINNFGWKQHNGVAYINCSCCDLPGNLVHHGVIVELSEGSVVNITESPNS